MTQSCDQSRGATECSWGRCFCNSGCSGADGKCYGETNKLIKTGFRLRNSRWPDQYMYVSSVGSSLKVSADPGDQADFELYQLPDQVSGPTLTECLLSSVKYPNYVTTITETHNCNGGDQHRQRSCTTSWDGTVTHVAWPAQSSLPGLATKLVAVRDRPGVPAGAFMIESFSSANYFLYVHRFSWQVGAYSGDPGTGGYWVAEPPLNLTIPEYRGVRCSYDCGFSGACRRCSSFAALLFLVTSSLLS